jgi:phage-related protein
MRRWFGKGAALAVTAGLFAAGCSAAAPDPGRTPAASPDRAAASATNTAASATTPATSATAPNHGPAATTAQSQPVRHSPTGFWSGTDSWPVPVSGRGPYRMPGIGGAYGGYVGMTGSWSYWLGCHGGFLAWSPANSAQADANYTRYGLGIGTAVYWFMGGPGVDPRYNGTTAEARAWGARQAARTLANMAGEHVTYPVVFMDIELPGVAPAFDNGWEDVYTSPCSGKVRHHGIPAAVDRADFNGFSSYLTTHSGYRAGVYAAPQAWPEIFGTGSAASIRDTYEWTYEPETASLASAPRGWCLRSGGCAQFFGGVTSSSRYALMWQWSGGGGVRNAIGDFDQISANRAP